MATRTYTFQNGQTADGGQVETEYNEIYTNITNDNIASGAAIAISKTALGTYTPWTDWTPTLTASGSMTWTSTSINEARYTQIGKIVFFKVNITGTVGGSLSTELQFTLPSTPTGVCEGGCRIFNPAANSGVFVYSAGKILVSLYNAAAWSSGTGGVSVQGFYQVA
jgi:hypothetical protein